MFHKNSIGSYGNFLLITIKFFLTLSSAHHFLRPKIWISSEIWIKILFFSWHKFTCIFYFNSYRKILTFFKKWPSVLWIIFIYHIVFCSRINGFSRRKSYWIYFIIQVNRLSIDFVYNILHFNFLFLFGDCFFWFGNILIYFYWYVLNFFSAFF